MHIDITGHGPDLILLHGWAMHSGIFAPLIDVLRERWTVHAVDLPGHGLSRDSSVPLTLDAMADALAADSPEAIWVGWSLGGLVAQHVSARRPDRVRALVSIASSPRFVAGDGWPYAVAPEVFRQFGIELASDWRGTVERFLALEVVGSVHAQEELRTLRERIYERGEPAPHTLADGLDLLGSADLRDQLSQLNMPGLWVAGRRDRLVPTAGLRAAADAMPHGRLLEIAGAGHAPFLHHSGRIVQAIADMMGDGV